MLICLDIGNTYIFGGIFKDTQLAYQFRYPSKGGCTSDELGIFLKSYLREMNIKKSDIKDVAICSVVPSLDYSVRSALIKYFSIEPFILQVGSKTGLKIKYKNPSEVGADRIANAIGASALFVNQNLIVADLGTATTFEAITAQNEFLGGAILPGLQMQTRALSEFTANLPSVRIQKACALGKSTMSNIQAGVYHAHLGAIKQIVSAYTHDLFQGERPIVIGTGGFSQLFEEENIFDSIAPDLVLQGLRIAYQKNKTPNFTKQPSSYDLTEL